MTDKEIIKALECCAEDEWCCNNNCPFFEKCSKTLMAKSSLDIIKRQQAEYNNLLEQFRILDCECERLEKADENQKAEIERLKIENQSLRSAANSYKLHYNEARTEAVKELIERLTKEYAHYTLDFTTTVDIFFCSVKRIAKEMAGDTE